MTTAWLKQREVHHASRPLGAAIDQAAIDEALRGAKDDLEGGPWH